ncbi:MAG: DUF1700 domain-containing protein [Oligoflexales bacterium]
MKKKDFLIILESKLAKLPTSERADILSDYEEHFTIGLESGKTEDEIAHTLGDPKRIGATYMTEVYARRMKEAKTPISLFSNSIYLLFAFLGLGFFNLVFVVGPYFAAVATLLSLWLVPLMIFGLVIVGLALTVKLWGAGIILSLFGLGILLCAIGVIAIGGMTFLILGFLSYWFAMASVKYVNFNIRILGQGVRE